MSINYIGPMIPQQAGDVGLGGLEVISDLLLRSACCVKPSHLRDIALAESSKAVFRSRQVSVPPLGVHVRDVIRSCTQPQVLWVTAGPVVAVMQDAEVTGDWPVRPLPRKAMGLTLAAVVIDDAVPTPILPQQPRPARIRAARTVNVPHQLFIHGRDFHTPQYTSPSKV